MNKRTLLPIDTITSSSNAEVKMLRSLHERKFRRQTGLFLAEGMRHCTEAVQMGYQPMRLVYAQGREADKGMATLIDACQKAGGRLLPVTPNLLSRISGNCLLYTSPSPRDLSTSRMPSSA